MKRRDFLRWMGAAGTAAALGGCATTGRGALSGRKPNVVVIVADDLGYADMGCQGCKDIPTPNIDTIAANGVRFTDGYVSCPVCSPTRAGLMTGRYQQRFGHEFNPGPAKEADPAFGLPLTETTIAARMKTAGYTTGMFGKWHLGYRPEFHPQRRGFDEFFGFLGGAHSYLDPEADESNPILSGEERVRALEYTTDAFAQHAADFIERHKDEPFFVYLPFNAVHAPLQSLTKYLGRFDTIEDKKRHTYAAMLSAMDDGIGLVLAKLRDLGLEDDTLIFFISDNGGPTPQTTSRNDPLRGYKGQVLEGGIRIPFLIQWKGRVPAGTVYRQPVISLDICPTILAAVGADAQGANLDGVDLLPYVSGKDARAPHDRLFWRFGEQSAIRMGDWKLERFANGEARLYHLSEDIAEGNDLAEKQPEKFKELDEAYQAWNATLAPPRWKQKAARNAGRAVQNVIGKPGKKRRRAQEPSTGKP